MITIMLDIHTMRRRPVSSIHVRPMSNRRHRSYIMITVIMTTTTNTIIIMTTTTTIISTITIITKSRRLSRPNRSWVSIVAIKLKQNFVNLLLLNLSIVARYV